MTTPPATTSLDSTLCLSAVSAQVCAQTVSAGVENQNLYWLITLSFTSSGYRHVRLLKLDGSSLSPASLFVHIKIGQCESSPSKSPAKSAAKKPWSRTYLNKSCKVLASISLTMMVIPFKKNTQLLHLCPLFFWLYQSLLFSHEGIWIKANRATFLNVCRKRKITIPCS